MSTDSNLMLTKPVKYSLYSNVIMTFFCKSHNNGWDKIDQQLIDSAMNILQPVFQHKWPHGAHTLKQKSKLINSLLQLFVNSAYAVYADSVPHTRF